MEPSITSQQSRKESPPIRIVVADGQSIFRHGLRRLLETDQGLTIVGEATDGVGTVAAVAASHPDILLLTTIAEGGAAVATLHDLAAAQLAVRTILLSDCIDTPYVLSSLQLGVRGVIPRDSAPEVLFSSIRSVMAGHYWVGREAVAEPVLGLQKLSATRRRTRMFGLTRRELDIVRAVIAGYTNKEIAERSAISENTVKSHLGHIFNKLGASNRVELALFATHHRLLDGV